MATKVPKSPPCMEHALPRAMPRLDQSSQNTTMPHTYQGHFLQVLQGSRYQSWGKKAAFLLTEHCWCVGDTEAKQEAVVLGAVGIWNRHSLRLNGSEVGSRIYSKYVCRTKRVVWFRTRKDKAKTMNNYGILFTLARKELQIPEFHNSSTLTKYSWLLVAYWKTTFLCYRLFHWFTERGFCYQSKTTDTEFKHLLFFLKKGVSQKQMHVKKATQVTN